MKLSEVPIGATASFTLKSIGVRHLICRRDFETPTGHLSPSLGTKISLEIWPLTIRVLSILPTFFVHRLEHKTVPHFQLSSHSCIFHEQWWLNDKSMYLPVHLNERKQALVNNILKASINQYQHHGKGRKRSIWNVVHY